MEPGWVGTANGLVDVAAVSGWSDFAGFTEEDLDTTPITPGCHDCYRTGGPRCDRCPDAGRPKKAGPNPAEAAVARVNARLARAT
jgi:hypothetical protein